MPGVARVTQDKTGNIIVGNLAPTVFVNNKPIAVVGAKIIPYGSDCKSKPKLGPGSSSVIAEGKSVCRKGVKDVCGTPVAAASSDVIAG